MLLKLKLLKHVRIIFHYRHEIINTKYVHEHTSMNFKTRDEIINTKYLPCKLKLELCSIRLEVGVCVKKLW